MFSSTIVASKKSFVLFALLPGFLLLLILIKAVTKFIYAFIYAYKKTKGNTQFDKVLEQKNKDLKSSFRVEYYLMLCGAICSLLLSDNWINTIILVIFIIIMMILNHDSK